MGDGREIFGIVVLSVQVSLTASLIGMAIGAPLGGWICTLRGRARRIWLAIFSALLAVPTVVVGLIVYILLSRSGPLGWLDILFTPTAIVIAQVIITLPVITVFSHRACAGQWAEHGDQIRLDIRARWRQVTAVSEPSSGTRIAWNMTVSPVAGCLLTPTPRGGRSAADLGPVSYPSEFGPPSGIRDYRNAPVRRRPGAWRSRRTAAGATRPLAHSTRGDAKRARGPVSLTRATWARRRGRRHGACSWARQVAVPGRCQVPR